MDSGDDGELRRQQAAVRAYARQADDGETGLPGYGTLAEQVIRDAKQAGLPVHDDPSLMTLLMGLNIDERVAPELYLVVAKLLNWTRGLQDLPPEEAMIEGDENT